MRTLVIILVALLIMGLLVACNNPATKPATCLSQHSESSWVRPIGAAPDVQVLMTINICDKWSS